MKTHRNRETEELLHLVNLRKTNCRQGIIDILTQSDEAMTENEIKSILDGNHNRTTFYRSFKILLQNNLIHRIVVDNQLTKYAITRKVRQNYRHIHIYCLDCDKILCLESDSFSEPQLPAGFKPIEIEIIIKGKCKKCVTA